MSTPLDGFVLNGTEYEMRDNLAQSRIDNLVAQNNPTEGNTELLDIRIGADGTAYDSAGQAVRGQITKIMTHQSQLLQYLKNGKILSIVNGNLLECAAETRENCFRYYQDGIINTNNDFISYEMIPATPETPFYPYKRDLHCCFFTEDKEFISGILTGSSSFTTPQGCGYICLGVLKSDVSPYLIKEEQPLEEDRIHQKWLYDIQITLESLKNIVTIGKNKFNRDCVKSGGYLAYNLGAFMENPSFCYTLLFEELKPDTEYYTNLRGGHICFYDSSYKYVGGSTGKNVFTTPTSCKYFKMSVSISDKNNCYVVEGNQPLKKYEPYCYKFINSSEESNNSVVIVSKDGTGDFSSVTEASANSPEGSIIYVMPGVYENEIITGTWSKKQFIVGTSAKDCIIKNSTGDYNYPPIQIGSGVLKNLTFYSEKTEESAVMTPSAYAVHVESNHLSEDTLTIENCILISDFAPAFGMGMRKGCDVLLKNTYFKSNAAQAVYFHDADNDDYVGEQKISIQDCILYTTKENYGAILLQSQEKPDSMIYVEMIRNRLKTQGSHSSFDTKNWYNGVGSGEDFLGVKNFRLFETSWGNSDDTFNA